MREEEIIKARKTIGGIDRKLYWRIHLWLRENFGKANKCENPECLGKSVKFNWAKLPDKPYDFKRENFIMACRSCHCLMDFTEKTIEKLRIAGAIKIQNNRKDIPCRVCGKIVKNAFPALKHCEKCRIKVNLASRLRWAENNKERMRERKYKWFIKHKMELAQ